MPAWAQAAAEAEGAALAAARWGRRGGGAGDGAARRVGAAAGIGSAGGRGTTGAEGRSGGGRRGGGFYLQKLRAGALAAAEHDSATRRGAAPTISEIAELVEVKCVACVRGVRALVCGSERPFAPRTCSLSRAAPAAARSSTRYTRPRFCFVAVFSPRVIDAEWVLMSAGSGSGSGSSGVLSEGSTGSERGHYYAVPWLRYDAAVAAAAAAAAVAAAPSSKFPASSTMSLDFSDLRRRPSVSRLDGSLDSSPDRRLNR
ncbi:uncharacterized protein LOC124764449 [Schistocerca piceifrons]|uniref:uncharacterized protein LOC124764449 n=1 Tax=Schistocerca piceifrons TaxID=274613 RepID=UPI001F5EC284|nr:uncharacterized protein LOC124764449 [Schistocerca piceifrons]